MKINHNISALNAWRNLNHTDSQMGKTLEKLSSGYKINRAGDGAATLVISEQMRAQIASLDQAVLNSEIAVSMVQTTEAVLSEVNNILVGVRQLAIHASNEGANDEHMLEADQAEIQNSLKTIDRIARQAQFGTRNLLDGSNGISGFAVGDGLKYISSTVTTKPSPPQGYEVDVTQVATRSSLIADRTLTAEEIKQGGVKFDISEGGRTISYTTKAGDGMTIIQNQLKSLVQLNGLNLDISLTPDNRLQLVHTKYGSDHNFTVASNKAGILSKEADVFEKIKNGVDIKGTIGGDLAYGNGQFLTAAEGTDAEGTIIEFTGKLAKKSEVSRNTEYDESGNLQTDIQYDENGQPIPISSEDTYEGSVTITNNSLMFQVGPNHGQTVSIALPNTNTNQLSRSVKNLSNFKSLADIDVRTWQGAQDTLQLVDDAIDKISSTRADLGAFQKNTLESNLSNLRYASENLVAAESSLRDTDMAKEMANYTKNQILLASGTAMLGQANQVPKSVLTLLNAQQ